MRRFFAIAALFLAAGCASTRAKGPVPSPEIHIVQTSGVPVAARGVTGPVPIRYAVRVANRAAETITLRRITAQSIGSGAYDLRSTSTPFNDEIAPETHRDVEFWASAFIADPTILGANGPVTLRLIVHFDSPKGEFDEVVVQQVNAMSGGREPR
jgi:hypothetical protein